MSKQSTLLLIFILLFLNSFGQPIRQFGVEEVVGLFDKTQTQVYKYLSEKHYSYKGTDEGIEMYENVTSMGTFYLSLTFKNSKVSLISTDESFLVAVAVRDDLLKNFFKVDRSFTEVKEFIPHNGCFYTLKNEWLGLTASYIISELDPYRVVVIYGRDPKNKVAGNLLTRLIKGKQTIEHNNEILLADIKATNKPIALYRGGNSTEKSSIPVKTYNVFFQGIKKFCDTFDDSWESVVTINRDEISIKIYPGENNSYHKNKTEVFRSAIGKIMNGKIFIKKGTKYIPDLYKFENGILYEMNDEGTYNDYKQCK